VPIASYPQVVSPQASEPFVGGNAAHTLQPLGALAQCLDLAYSFDPRRRPHRRF
jgi:hypothetical protein